MSLLNSLTIFGFYSNSQECDNLFISLISQLDLHRKAIKKISPNKKDDKVKKKSIIKKILSSIYKFYHKNTSLKQYGEMYIAFTESLVGMTLVILVVIFVVIGVIDQFFIPTTSVLYTDLNILSYAATSFFTIDLIIRLISYKLVYRKMSIFFNDKFNVMDFLLVLLDLTLSGI